MPTSASAQAMTDGRQVQIVHVFDAPRELDAPKLIVLRTDPIPEVGIHHPTINRVTFEAVGQRTRMTFTAGPYPDEVFADSETGWNSIVSRLDQLLRR